MLQAVSTISTRISRHWRCGRERAPYLEHEDRIVVALIVESERSVQLSRRGKVIDARVERGDRERARCTQIVTSFPHFPQGQHFTVTKLAIWVAPVRAVFAGPSPPPFETEVDALQLSDLGLQTEGFFLARLELQRESGGFFLARQELPLESGGFFLAPLELHF
jgi:hypothetical protein